MTPCSSASRPRWIGIRPWSSPRWRRHPGSLAKRIELVDHPRVRVLGEDRRRAYPAGLLTDNLLIQLDVDRHAAEDSLEGLDSTQNHRLASGLAIGLGDQQGAFRVDLGHGCHEAPTGPGEPIRRCGALRAEADGCVEHGNGGHLGWAPFHNPSHDGWSRKGGRPERTNPGCVAPRFPLEPTSRQPQGARPKQAQRFIVAVRGAG